MNCRDTRLVKQAAECYGVPIKNVVIERRCPVHHHRRPGRPLVEGRDYSTHTPMEGTREMTTTPRAEVSTAIETLRKYGVSIVSTRVSADCLHWILKIPITLAGFPVDDPRPTTPTTTKG